MNQDPAGVLELFRSLAGHFRLRSGLHSGEYLQCALVLRCALDEAL